MPKSVFGRGSASGPAKDLMTLPRFPSRLGRGHPSPHLTPLGTNPPSPLAMRPPEFQPDLRLCVCPCCLPVVHRKIYIRTHNLAKRLSV